LSEGYQVVEVTDVYAGLINQGLNGAQAIYWTARQTGWTEAEVSNCIQGPNKLIPNGDLDLYD